jgi:hypothetical protein
VKKTGLVSITSEEVSLDKIEEGTPPNRSSAASSHGRSTHGTGAAHSRQDGHDPVRLRCEIQTARAAPGKGEPPYQVPFSVTNPAIVRPLAADILLIHALACSVRLSSSRAV